MEEKAGGLAIDAEGGVRGIAYLDGLALGVDELALVAETAPATVAERAADFSLRHDGGGCLDTNEPVGGKPGRNRFAVARLGWY